MSIIADFIGVLIIIAIFASLIALFLSALIVTTVYSTKIRNIPRKTFLLVIAMVLSGIGLYKMNIFPRAFIFGLSEIGGPIQLALYFLFLTAGILFSFEILMARRNIAQLVGFAGLVFIALNTVPIFSDYAYNRQTHQANKTEQTVAAHVLVMSKKTIA